MFPPWNRDPGREVKEALREANLAIGRKRRRRPVDPVTVAIAFMSAAAILFYALRT